MSKKIKSDDENLFSRYCSVSNSLNNYLIKRDSFLDSYLDTTQKNTLQYLLYSYDACHRMRKEVMVSAISAAISNSANLPNDEDQKFLDLLVWVSSPENHSLMDWLFGGHVNLEYVYQFFSEAYSRDGVGLIFDLENSNPFKRLTIDKTDTPIYPSDVLDILIRLSDTINPNEPTVH